MQYIPCNSTLLAQETLFLTQKGTFLPKDLQKVRKSQQILIRNKIFRLKIFIWVLTLRRGPLVPSQNFCNPDHCSNSCVLSVHVVHQGGGLAHQGEGLVHQGQGLVHHGEGQQDPTGTLRRLPHPRHDRSILRHHSKDKTSAQRVGFLNIGSGIGKNMG